MKPVGELGDERPRESPLRGDRAGDGLQEKPQASGECHVSVKDGAFHGGLRRGLPGGRPGNLHP